MAVNHNFPEHHEERLPYITLVFIDLNGMFDLRWLLHVGVIWESFDSIVFLLVGDLKKHTQNKPLLSFRNGLNSYLLNFNVC